MVDVVLKAVHSRLAIAPQEQALVKGPHCLRMWLFPELLCDKQNAPAVDYDNP